MNDLHELLDRSADRIAGDSGLDRLRIRQILAKRIEDRMKRLSPEQATLDLGAAGSILLSELTEAAKCIGPERAFELCERTDLDRLIVRRLYVQDWSRPDPILYTGPELALRLAELQSHIVCNRKHLLATGYPVVMPSKAHHLLSSPWWRRFGILYPTKIPAGQSGVLDSTRTPLYTYVWSRRPGRPFLTREQPATRQGAEADPESPPEKTCEYESAPPMEGMSAEDATRLESLRGRILEFEIGVLGALIETVSNSSADGAWKSCLPWLTGSGREREQRLTGHDIEFLLGVDRFYAGPNAFTDSAIHVGIGTIPGAFSHLVLLIALCDWVAASGLTRKIREILDAAGLTDLKPLRPPRLAIRSPYQIAGTPAETALDAAIGVHRASADEAATFFESFFRRVKELIDRDVPVPVGVEMWVPRRAEKDARGMLEVFSTVQKSHLEQFGRPMPLTLGGDGQPDLDPASPAAATHSNREKPRWPFPNPEGTQWENVSMTLHGEGRVRIRLNGEERIVAYAEMGLADARHGKPNTQWAMLCLFATRQQITWKTPEASRRLKDKKRFLSRALRAFFPGIPGDPFRLIDRRKGWEPRFQIRP